MNVGIEWKILYKTVSVTQYYNCYGLFLAYKPRQNTMWNRGPVGLDYTSSPQYSETQYPAEEARISPLLCIYA